MKTQQEQLLSLVIPIYNEEDQLQEFLEKVDALELPIDKELILVDDCSSDASLSIVKAFDFKSKHTLIEKKANEGKGAALRSGIEKAQGSFIGIQDADFEYDLADIPRIIEPLIKDSADAVFGSRYRNSPLVHRTFHYLINKILTVFSNLSSGLYLSDMETCYKFFKAEILKNIILESNRFGFEPEITAKIARLKIRLAEIPISYFPRNYIEGKKITWKDGIAAIGHIIRFNYFRRWNQCFREDLPKKYVPKGQHWL